MRIIKLSMLFVALATIYSCTTDQFTDPQEESSKVELSLTSNVEGTRKLNNTWELGDKIGVYAWKSDKNLSQSTVEQNIYNTPFITEGNSLFHVDPSRPMVEHPTNKSLNFIAYYPFSTKTDLEDFIYPIDITNQADIESIDFLYSNNLKNLDSPTQRANLVFKHQLSKLKIVLSSTSENLEGARVIVRDIPTGAYFNLVQGTILPRNESADVVANSNFYKGALEADVLIIPNESLGSITIDIILTNGTVFTWKTPNDWKWSSNTTYTKYLQLDGDSPVDPDPQPQTSYLEYPDISNITNRQQIVMHMDPENTSQRSFTMLYDKDMLFAYWIAFPHHKYYIGGTKRTNAWGYDPDIDPKYQPKLPSSYSGNYSRGHQVASSDRTRSKAMNKQTFYYSNMTPQVQSFNGAIWLKLERAIQGLVKTTNDTVYVVTGAGVYDKAKMRSTTTKSGQRAPIPDYYYKLMARKVKGNYKTIAYFFEHKPSNGDYRNHSTTVKEVEEITGFKFYPGLPSSSKEVVSTEVWN